MLIKLFDQNLFDTAKINLDPVIKDQTSDSFLYRTKEVLLFFCPGKFLGSFLIKKSRSLTVNLIIFITQC